MWSKEKINKHLTACKILSEIKDSTFEYIRKNRKISEYEVQRFILEQFKEKKVKNDKDKPIVAFNEDSAIPHFFPKRKSKKLKKRTLILIDIWARLKVKSSPFSDITWVAYYGEKIPEKIQNVFNVVIKSRDSALKFIKTELKKGRMPTGREVDKIARDIINKKGFYGKFIHGTGHSIGFISPHGNRGNLKARSKQKLLINLGYTIEPGIYLKNEFGIRSEINFYINKNKNLIITTPAQKKIIKI
jgi:Xaa-Pro aminopeptidase